MHHTRGTTTLAAALALCGGAHATATTLADFSDTLVASVPYPTDLAFTPDGRMLITTQPGYLRIYSGGALLPTPALDLTATICSNAERGLLGVAVDPDFAANGFIYVFYTFNRFGSAPPCPVGLSGNLPNNRVSRFLLGAGNVVNPATELVLIDNIPSLGGNHNAGDVELDSQGRLYVSSGDSAVTPGNARLTSSLSGKILRVARDGSIPADNPWASAPGSRRCGDPAGVPPGSGPCQEVISVGLRNPFRIAFRPGTDEFYINDVGQGAWEEIDLGIVGADYGWNFREGPCNAFNLNDCGPPPPSMTNPIYSYHHNTGCACIAGGAFVPAGVWPATYDGAYLFGEVVCGRVFHLVPDGSGGFTRSDMVWNLLSGAAVSMRFGPDGTGQSLYYANYNGNGSMGQMRKLAYTGSANRSPAASAVASPAYGPVPLTVDLDASASTDADGDPMTYDWDFGDGASANGLTVPTTSHVYATPAVRTVTLVVRDDKGGASAPFTLRVDPGNTPPAPAIAFPAPGSRFSVGQSILLQGSASDAEDGTLPASSLTWDVILHHVDENNPGNAHTHPYIPPTAGNNVPFTAPAPEDLAATRYSYLEVRLTAVDSWGLTQTVTREFEPVRVDVTVASAPAALQLRLQGVAFTGSRSVVSWQNYGLSLDVVAPVQEDAGGSGWTFASWSDGGAMAHVLPTPGSPIAVTASFLPENDPAATPSLLRNDDVADLAAAAAMLPAICARYPADPSLLTVGPNRLGEPGEGGLQAGNGSSDDDDFYAYAVAPGWVDPDPSVATDPARPLVLYQLDQSGRTLLLRKAPGGGIELQY